MYKRILVPIDGSDPAERGLAEAIALARELKATIRLLNLTSDFVLMVEMSSAIDYEKFREGLNQFGQRLLAKASEQAKAQGVATETSLHDLDGGRVADAIVEEARKSRCDLIVIGTHGRGVLGRLLLGSTAEWVVRHAPCPVLTVAHSPHEPYLYEVAGAEEHVATGPAGTAIQQKSSVSGTGSHVGWPLVTSA